PRTSLIADAIGALSSEFDAEVLDLPAQGGLGHPQFRGRLAFIALEEMSLLPAAPRLARRLLMMAENYGEGEPRRVIHLPQEQLALMLAISRQTTNQILKELEGQGIVRLTYGEIEILDLARLRQAAC
ncbi:MAG: helix-turn-helix domain-containing protein, partial [Pseudomonas sp.]|nr:helix-turn-helix domain-containing protein [Pseudomonas sp.]